MTGYINIIFKINVFYLFTGFIKIDFFENTSKGSKDNFDFSSISIIKRLLQGKNASFPIL